MSCHGKNPRIVLIGHESLDKDKLQDLRKLHDLGIAQLPQQLCFCSWGGSDGENTVPAESYLFIPSFAPNQTAPNDRSLLRGAARYFGWKVTGLTIMQKKKKKGIIKKWEKFLSSASCRWAWEQVLPIYQPHILFLLPVWIPLTAWAMPFPDCMG